MAGTGPVVGGVARELAAPAPVIGGVKRASSGLYVAQGGVQKGVWPGFPVPGKTVGAYTWAEIAQVSAAGLASQYWRAGQMKSEVINGATYTMKIIGFDHDKLADSDAMYGTGYNGGSNKAGITFQMVEIFATYPLHHSNGYRRRWVETEMYLSILPAIKGDLSPDLQDVIRSIGKYTTNTVAYAYVYGAIHQLFLLSEIEVFGSLTYAYPNTDLPEGKQYPYFVNDSSKMKKYNGSAYPWWLRSPARDEDYFFAAVSQYGQPSKAQLEASYGVSFGFCI